jgi:hypothetical protein
VQGQNPVWGESPHTSKHLTSVKKAVDVFCNLCKQEALSVFSDFPIDEC